MRFSLFKGLVFLAPLIILTSLGIFFLKYRTDYEINVLTLKRPYRIPKHLPIGITEDTHPQENQEEPAQERSDSEEEDQDSDVPSEADFEIEEERREDTAEPLPANILLDVPFAPQSPYAVWDERDQESCEEASLIIVHYFWQGKALSREIMRRELDKLIDYQLETYHDYKDSDAYAIAHMAREYFGYENTEVKYNISIEDIKNELALGHPVIVPAAGRELNNPYYTPPGPLYHNLVIVGYNAEGFFTNDPGTKRGENYFYTYGLLYNAIHDFPGVKEYILDGRKAMIVVK